VEQKVSVNNRQLREQQKLVGFQYVHIEKRRPVQKEDGSYRGLPTLYLNGQFWELFESVQWQCRTEDLLKLPRVARLARYASLVESWGSKRGCKPLDRAQKQQKSKTATASEAAGAEPGGITVARAMHELQQMPRSDQFQFAKDFTETVTGHLIADSQDYDEGAHIFSKIQTSALIGGKSALDDLRQRIARLNRRGVTVKPGLRAAALRQCLDETAAMLLKYDQLALLCEASDFVEGADFCKRSAASLRDFRWAMSEDRKGKVSQDKVSQDVEV
jgi:hypothetical protein